MQSYFLDLTTLLQILSRQKQSGVLQVGNIHLPGIKQSVQARLILIYGRVDSCILFLEQGNTIAEGAKALQMLYELDALEWRWAADLQGMARTTSPLPVPSEELPQADREPPIPRRTARAEMAALHTLSRNHRRVLALVDGRRPIDKIASMLSFTDQQELLKVLRELQTWGLITWDPVPAEH